jgi:lipooligosaccharide transport system permease protein
MPLYQSIQLIREPALGALSWRAAVPMGYLLLLGVLATRLAIRRMSRLMLK